MEIVFSLNFRQPFLLAHKLEKKKQPTNLFQFKTNGFQSLLLQLVLHSRWSL